MAKFAKKHPDFKGKKILVVGEVLFGGKSYVFSGVSASKVLHTLFADGLDLSWDEDEDDKEVLHALASQLLSSQVLRYRDVKRPTYKPHPALFGCNAHIYGFPLMMLVVTSPRGVVSVSEFDTLPGLITTLLDCCECESVNAVLRTASDLLERAGQGDGDAEESADDAGSYEKPAKKSLSKKVAQPAPAKAPIMSQLANLEAEMEVLMNHLGYMVELMRRYGTKEPLDDGLRAAHARTKRLIAKVSAIKADL